MLISLLCLTLETLYPFYKSLEEIKNNNNTRKKQVYFAAVSFEVCNNIYLQLCKTISQ